MKYKHKKHNTLVKYFFCLFSVITLLFIVATSNNKKIIVTSNVNTVKAIETSRIVTIEKEYNDENYIEVISIDEFLNNINNNIKFTGNIKGYYNKNFSCKLDSQILNNIYYKDSKYGKLRILSAS